MTPALLAAAYELLCETHPFRLWNLPPAADVTFAVTRSKRTQGDHHVVNGKHMIRLSAVCHHYLPTILATMAHEMIHMHENAEDGRRRPRVRRRCTSRHHTKAFHRWADDVCRVHGFDRGQF